MLQVRPVFVREAALLLAELAGQATAGDGFARALEERRGGAGRAMERRPQPERASGFEVHAFLPEGPERAGPPFAFAAYAARLAHRMVFEGPVAGLRLSA
ncbi:MAG: hypothetical protein H6852_04630 [Geminicoccaceae bacterium]|jgi:hypothetical protein|nr:hypothetical protein [Geminicoccaceae bacterium]MCB9966911.1 hypothetical protein [Geminicoccaceae bacterium]HRY25616.1 hypothetical protein [Geminicoccaceae bacterium]